MANLVAVVGVYRWKTEGQSEGDLPRDPTLPWLRPRTLLGLPRDPSRLGLRLHATPSRIPSRDARYILGSISKYRASRSSSFIRGSSATIGLTWRSPRFFPFRASFSISTISLFRFHSSSFILSISLFLFPLPLLLVELLLFPLAPELPVSCT